MHSSHILGPFLSRSLLLITLLPFKQAEHPEIYLCCYCFFDVYCCALNTYGAIQTIQDSCCPQPLYQSVIVLSVLSPLSFLSLSELSHSFFMLLYHSLYPPLSALYCHNLILHSSVWPYAVGCVRNYAVASEQKDEASSAVRSKQAQHFDWALAKLDSSVRRTGRITKTLLLRIFHDICRTGRPAEQ